MLLAQLYEINPMSVKNTFTVQKLEDIDFFTPFEGVFRVRVAVYSTVLISFSGFLLVHRLKTQNYILKETNQSNCLHLEPFITARN